MRTLHLAPHQAQLQNLNDAPLTLNERRRITLAALAIQEQRYKKLLVDIQLERRSILAELR